MDALDCARNRAVEIGDDVLRAHQDHQGSKPDRCDRDEDGVYGYEGAAATLLLSRRLPRSRDRADPLHSLVNCPSFRFQLTA